MQLDDASGPGIVAAKERGVLIGRRPALNQSRLRLVRKLVAEGEKPAAVARMLKVGRATVYRALRASKGRYPTTKIESSTAHSAKGLEADFVILINVVAGWNGFPSLRPDDHCIERLLPGGDGFPESEERRLFYVAITRARKAVIACKPILVTSPFIDELRTMTPAPRFETLSAIGGDEPTIICRSCGVGKYVLKEGKHGAFASCSEFPRCRETAALCPECNIGIMGLLDGNFVCTDAACGFSAAECPECHRGWLTSRKGRRGPFIGCSRWRPNRAGCDYTAVGEATGTDDVILF